ncbi:hypothetical protein CPT_Moby_073 [Stenotrophomonas phage Moby]|uniref:Uncharacterized protein n=1 Tax=Stenotrophomonas phage Moby TaxID=2601680 RepID=A0A5P8PM53_9CAUD|nr:hypothetical protein HWC58_gp073 [Stenotrophomonas phage Moby]QFR57821.1 hypothetical protein CPT_Moby_073 [Stenotrophomonas phage Moby]
MNKIQKRGICQVCGREQAVNKGVMAKHGYTIEYGFFNGTCPGAAKQPLNVTRETLDIIIVQQKEVVASNKEMIEALKAGTKRPLIVRNWRGEDVKWEEANEYEQKRGIESAIWNMEGDVRGRENWMVQMNKLAEVTLGTELREVIQQAGPARIERGEKKVSGSGRVLTAMYQDKARVYYNFDNGAGKILKGWIGSSAWRKLADA